MYNVYRFCRSALSATGREQFMWLILTALALNKPCIPPKPKKLKQQASRGAINKFLNLSRSLFCALRLRLRSCVSRSNIHVISGFFTSQKSVAGIIRHDTLILSQWSLESFCRCSNSECVSILKDFSSTVKSESYDNSSEVFEMILHKLMEVLSG